MPCRSLSAHRDLLAKSRRCFPTQDVIHPDLGRRTAALEQQAVHDIDHLFTLDPLIDVDRQALAGIGIDNISSLNQLRFCQILLILAGSIFRDRVTVGPSCSRQQKNR